MTKLLRTIKSNKSGASAAEYALMIALIGGAIILAATTLGTNVKKVFTDMGTQMTTADAKIGAS